MFKRKKGFTLIEILLVIALIAILAGIVLFAINPTRQIQQGNDAQRQSDVNSLLGAIGNYSVDNRGALPTSITTTATVIGSGTGLINLCADLTPKYIAKLPFDPTASGASWTDCTSYNTGYTVMKDANNRVTVAAPSAQVATSISVTR